MRDKRLEEMRQDYENIRIPEELRERVEAGIRQAKEEKQMKNKRRILLGLRPSLLVVITTAVSPVVRAAPDH